MSTCQLNQCDNHDPDKQLLPISVKRMVGRLQSANSGCDVVSGVNPPVMKKASAICSQERSESKRSDDGEANGLISGSEVVSDLRVPPVPTPRRKKVESVPLSSTPVLTTGDNSRKFTVPKSASMNGGSYRVATCDSESRPPAVNRQEVVVNECFKSELQQRLVTQTKNKSDSASMTWKPKPPNKQHLSARTVLPSPKPVLTETLSPPNSSVKQTENQDVPPSKVYFSSQADGHAAVLQPFCESPNVPIAGCSEESDSITTTNTLSDITHEMKNHGLQTEQNLDSLTKQSVADGGSCVSTKVHNADVPIVCDKAVRDADRSSSQPYTRSNSVSSKPLPLPRSPVSPPVMVPLSLVAPPPPLVPRKPAISADKKALFERRLPPEPLSLLNITRAETCGNTRKPMCGSGNNSGTLELKAAPRVGVSVGKATDQLSVEPKSVGSQIGASRSLIDLRPNIPDSSVKASQSLRAPSTSRESFDSDDGLYEDIEVVKLPERSLPTPPRFMDDETQLNEIYECLTPNLASLNSIFDESEPLYQVYHHNAVVRQVVLQNTDDVDDDSDYVEYETQLRNYVLKKSGDEGVAQDGKTQEGSSLEHRDATNALSVLLSTQRSSYMRLWCEMPPVKDSNMLKAMSSDERRLQESQFEVISSELSYLRSMNIVIDHFMAAFSKSFDQDKEIPTLERDDFNRLFSNTRAVRVASAKFACALDTLWKSSCILDPAELARTITGMVQPDFDVYVIYCSNAMYQDRKLRELLEQNVEFQVSLRRLERDSCCQSLPLASFLTLPMQRITRYPLLISAICRSFEKARSVCVPNELSNCLSVLQKIVDRCNEGARKMSNLEQMMEIHKVIDFKACQGVPLISESRFFVKKGPLVQLLKPSPGFFRKTKRTLHFYLFSDILLITKKKSLLEKRFHVFQHCLRVNVHAKVISEEEAASRLMFTSPGSGSGITAKGAPTTSSAAGYRNTFSLTLLDQDAEFILCADSPSERERWVQAFSPPVSEDDDERIYESWDCPQVLAVARHVAQEPDELSFEESDIISVFRKLSDGWYEGERIRDGRRGWFQSELTVEVQNAHVRARNLREQYQLKLGTSS